MSGLGGALPLNDVQAQLQPGEDLARQIDDLTAALQASLPPTAFALVWALRDAVEQLAIVDQMLHERRLLERLARHLPECAATIRAATNHVLTADVPTDEPVEPDR